MNKVCLVGRLTKDPVVNYTTGENATAIARLTVAVDRRMKNANGEYEADFPSVVAFGKTAEFIEKYFKKGMRIGLVGRIQTGSYTNKDGVKVYTTDVIAEDVEFVESKGSNDTSTVKATVTTNDFVNVPDNADDSGLPF